MLKREITYEDFEGNTKTEDFYFNLTKTELVELETSYKKGIEAAFQDILDSGDRMLMLQEFKRLILMAYGEKSEDGKRFVKSEDLSVAFTQTPAYDVLFMDLFTKEGLLEEFFIGLIPRDIAGTVREEMKKREAAEKAKAAQDERQSQAEFSEVTDVEVADEQGIVPGVVTPSEVIPSVQDNPVTPTQ